MLKEPVPFTGYYILSNIFPKNNVRYTGLHKVDRTGTVIKNSGINLAPKEWEAFVANINVLKQMVDKDNKRNKFLLRKEIVVNSKFCLYKWVWSYNDVPLSEHNQKSGEFYTREEAKIEGECFTPTEDNEGSKIFDWSCLKLDIIGEPTAPPEATYIMRVVYLFLLKKYIQEKRFSVCSACDIEAPGQRDHMAVGNCLDFEMDEEVFLDEAIDAVKVTDMMHLFDNCRKSIGFTPIFSHLLANAAKSFLCRADLKESLSSDVWIRNSVYENVKYVHTLLDLPFVNYKQ